MKTKLKDNNIFRWIIIPLSLILCFIGHFIPETGTIPKDALTLILIFIGILILWLTIGIDWPSILCLFSLGFIPSFGFNKVFTSSFGNGTFFFLLFTFVATYALSKTSLIKRTAIGFINFKLARKNSYLFIFFFLLGTLFLGLFISPSVLFLILLPILKEIYELLEIEKESKMAKVMMLGLGFSVSISSGMTPIAHVFPILAINAANLTISTLEYTLIALPSGFILFILMYFLLILFIKPEKREIDFDKIKKLKNNLEKINKKDITVLIIFIVILILWIIPSLFENIYPPIYEFFSKYGTAMPPLLGVIALLIIRIGGEPIIKVDEAFTKGVPWSSLMMCAATLALGEAFKSNDIGLIIYLENTLSTYLINLSPILLLIIFSSWAAIQTNLSSNMVTATLVATIASSVITITMSSINIYSVIVIIGMLSSFAFATPPSMPHIAIISASESASTKDCLIYGSIVMLISIIISLIISYPLGLLIF